MSDVTDKSVLFYNHEWYRYYLSVHDAIGNNNENNNDTISSDYETCIFFSISSFFLTLDTIEVRLSWRLKTCSIRTIYIYI